MCSVLSGDNVYLLLFLFIECILESTLLVSTLWSLYRASLHCVSIQSICWFQNNCQQSKTTFIPTIVILRSILMTDIIHWYAFNPIHLNCIQCKWFSIWWRDTSFPVSGVKLLQSQKGTASLKGPAYSAPFCPFHLSAPDVVPASPRSGVAYFGNQPS